MRWQCPECGFFAAGFNPPARHVCQTDAIVKFQMKNFDKQYKDYLSSNHGQFALAYADLLIHSQEPVQPEEGQGGSQLTKE